MVIVLRGNIGENETSRPIWYDEGDCSNCGYLIAASVEPGLKIKTSNWTLKEWCFTWSSVWLHFLSWYQTPLKCWSIIDLKINFITCTSHNQGLGLEGILEADHQGLSEGIDHGEDHPDLDQLDVGSARKGLADPEKTEERWKLMSFVLH